LKSRVYFYILHVLLLLMLCSWNTCSHQQPVTKNDVKTVTTTRQKRKPIPKSQSSSVNSRKTDSDTISDFKITMNFIDARLTDVLKIIAKEFKANLVIPNDNSSRVTVYLNDVTLHEALDMILSSLDYSYLKKGQKFFILKNSERISHIYKLKYAHSLDVKQILEGMSQDAYIASDELTNTVIVTDKLGNLKTYDEVIASLDAFQPSVLIEAEIYEVSLDNVRDIGIEWTTNYEKNNSQFVAQSPVSTSITNLFLSYKNLNAPQIELMLKALQSNTESHLLSSPRIVTMNNQEAKILVGERVPYVKASTATAAGAVMEEVEFVDVGILLKVTPRIVLEEGMVFIDVQPEVSEVMDMEVQGVPRIGTREAQTRVAVSDGETVVIGGLIRKDKVKSNTAIPFLEKIPLLNIFFKNRSDTYIKRELIVFITPHILTREHYLEMTTDRHELIN